MRPISGELARFRPASRKPDLFEKCALRPATLRDAADLLRWRNDPETRYFRNDARMVGWTEHVKWLLRRQSSSSNVHIFEVDGQPAGNITLDVENASYEFGWIVAPEFRRLGLGRRMVLMAIHLVQPDGYIWAKLRQDNIVSFNLAKSCGFVPVSQRGTMIYLARARCS